MLKEAQEQLFQKYDYKFKEMIKEMREERQKAWEARLVERQEFHREMISGRRWIAGVIVSVGIALAGYLSALNHFTH